MPAVALIRLGRNRAILPSVIPAAAIVPRVAAPSNNFLAAQHQIH